MQSVKEWDAAGPPADHFLLHGSRSGLRFRRYVEAACIFVSARRLDQPDDDQDHANEIKAGERKQEGDHVYFRQQIVRLRQATRPLRDNANGNA